MQSLNISNILESLRSDVVCGKITIREAAEELHEAGWMNYVDEEKTKALLKVKGPSLDSTITHAKQQENISPKGNEYYKTSDGWFDFYVNTLTGKKKLRLDEGDVEVDRKADDFYRGR